MFFTKKPISPYDCHATGDLCVENLALLADREWLLTMARKMVHESGYSYKKGWSQSKVHGGDVQPAVKRAKVSADERVIRLQSINEELKDLNKWIVLKDKRLEVAESERKYKLCEELS